MKNTGSNAIERPLRGGARSHRLLMSGLLALALAAGWAMESRAQVSVEVFMERDQFMPGETIPVSVRVINHSGQTLHFGAEKWLTFAVESPEGFVVEKLGDPVIAHDFDVASSDMATQHSELGPYFAMTRQGRYRVTATVRIKNWETDLMSAPKNFTVIRGVKIWEEEFGVPESPATASHRAPETRKYILQEATYLKSMSLYLRVTDRTEQRVFGVLRVGPVVSFSRPQTILDRENNLHVLYEESARKFNYSVVNPDGELRARQTFDYLNSGPPRLVLDDAGKVAVSGGVRHKDASDLPAPSKTVTLSNDAAPIKP